MDRFAKMVANGQISRAEAQRRRRQATLQRQGTQAMNPSPNRRQPVNNQNLITWTTTTWTPVAPNAVACFNMYDNTNAQSPASAIGTHFKLVSVDVVIISGIMIATDRASRLVLTLSAENIVPTGDDTQTAVTTAMTKQGHIIVPWPQFTEKTVTLTPRVGDIVESNRGALWLFIGNSNADALPIRGPGPGETIPALPVPYMYRLVYKIRQYNNALNL